MPEDKHPKHRTRPLAERYNELLARQGKATERAGQFREQVLDAAQQMTQPRKQAVVSELHGPLPDGSGVMVATVGEGDGSTWEGLPGRPETWPNNYDPTGTPPIETVTPEYIPPEAAGSLPPPPAPQPPPGPAPARYGVDANFIAGATGVRTVPGELLRNRRG